PFRDLGETRLELGAGSEQQLGDLNVVASLLAPRLRTQRCPSERRVELCAGASDGIRAAFEQPASDLGVPDPGRVMEQRARRPTAGASEEARPDEVDDEIEAPAQGGADEHLLGVR